MARDGDNDDIVNKIKSLLLYGRCRYVVVVAFSVNFIVIRFILDHRIIVDLPCVLTRVVVVMISNYILNKLLLDDFLFPSANKKLSSSSFSAYYVRSSFILAFLLFFVLK